MGDGRATAALRARAGPCAKLGERVVRLRRGRQARADERAHTDVRAATSDRGASLRGDDCASHVFSCSALPPCAERECKSAVCGDHFVERESPRVIALEVKIF